MQLEPEDFCSLLDLFEFLGLLSGVIGNETSVHFNKTVVRKKELKASVLKQIRCDIIPNWNDQNQPSGVFLDIYNQQTGSVIWHCRTI